MSVERSISCGAPSWRLSERLSGKPYRGITRTCGTASDPFHQVVERPEPKSTAQPPYTRNGNKASDCCVNFAAATDRHSACWRRHDLRYWRVVTAMCRIRERSTRRQVRTFRIVRNRSLGTYQGSPIDPAQAQPRRSSERAGTWPEWRSRTADRRSRVRSRGAQPERGSESRRWLAD